MNHKHQPRARASFRALELLTLHTPQSSDFSPRAFLRGEKVAKPDEGGFANHAISTEAARL
jgi:hypothetical protein